VTQGPVLLPGAAALLLPSTRRSGEGLSRRRKGWSASRARGGGSARPAPVGLSAAVAAQAGEVDAGAARVARSSGGRQAQGASAVGQRVEQRSADDARTPADLGRKRLGRGGEVRGRGQRYGGARRRARTPRNGGEQARSEVDLWLAAGSGEMGKMECRHQGQGVRPWRRGGGPRRGLGLPHGDAHVVTVVAATVAGPFIPTSAPCGGGCGQGEGWGWAKQHNHAGEMEEGAT
jgi:hypothetical protein